ncbi:MAG: hypothetical protein U0T81_09355 [Saprospiraceae bacterium]
MRNSCGEFFDGKSKTIAGPVDDKPFKVIESDFNDVDSSFLREDLAAAADKAIPHRRWYQKKQTHRHQHNRQHLQHNRPYNPNQPPRVAKPSVESGAGAFQKRDRGAVKPVPTCTPSAKPDGQNGSAVKPPSSVTKPSAI